MYNELKLKKTANGRHSTMLQRPMSLEGKILSVIFLHFNLLSHVGASDLFVVYLYRDGCTTVPLRWW